MPRFGIFSMLLSLAACGGAGAPAESPKTDEASAPSTSADKDGPNEPNEPNEASNDKPDAKNAAKAPASKTAAPEADAKLTRSARDILTAPDVVFLFSFNDSDVKQTADSKCTASSGNDPKKMNQCMAKARQAIDIDGYRFKEKDGKWFWLTLRTQGKLVHTLHKFEIDFGPEKPNSVTVMPKGKDLGSARGRTPASVTFDVPNEYQIVLNDSKLGRLVYEAKIGIASD